MKMSVRCAHKELLLPGTLLCSFRAETAKAIFPEPRRSLFLPLPVFAEGVISVSFPDSTSGSFLCLVVLS